MGIINDLKKIKMNEINWKFDIEEEFVDDVIRVGDFVNTSNVPNRFKNISKNIVQVEHIFRIDSFSDRTYCNGCDEKGISHNYLNIDDLTKIFTMGSITYCEGVNKEKSIPPKRDTVVTDWWGVEW